MTRTATKEQTAVSPDWRFDDVAVAYERHLVPAFFAAFAERLVATVSPAPGARVLDLACGTGVVARTVAARLGSTGTIAACDMSEGMMRVGQEIAEGAKLPIVWKQGEADRIPFPDGSFDIVYCQQGLQFFPDPVRALGEVRRVLAPGGRVAYSVWRHLRHNLGKAALVEALERHAGPDVADIMRVPFPERDAKTLGGYAKEAGFRNVRARLEVGSSRFRDAEAMLTAYAESTPIKAAMLALPAATRAAMVADLARVLAEHEDDDGIVWPLVTYVVTGDR